ncbi:MAG: hypothetical protein H7A51_12815 [Akkermansiaceae bacterium]|nr:hypothetical protein [Akkermansiaceae bacterium]
MKSHTYFNPGFLSRLFCVVIIATLCLPTGLDAKNNNKNKNKNKQPASKKGAASELPKINSVKKDSIVFNGKIYYFADNIKVFINGEEGTTGQLRAGMQALVSARIHTYGKDGADNTYIATRITARVDNKLAEKARAANKKAADAAKKQNQKNNKKNNKRR